MLKYRSDTLGPTHMFIGSGGDVKRSITLILAIVLVHSVAAQERSVTLPDEVAGYIVLGDIESLSAYVDRNGDFSNKHVEEPELGNPGVAFLLATLPIIGIGNDGTDDHLYRDDPAELERVRQRNERVGRFLFENGADPRGSIDIGFGAISYTAYIFVSMANYVYSDPEVIERLVSVVTPHVELFVEYGAEFELPGASVMSILVSSMLGNRELFDLALASGADPSAELDGISAIGGYLATAYQDGNRDPYFVRRMLSQDGVVEALIDRDSPIGLGYFGLAISLDLEDLVRDMLAAGQDANSIQVHESESSSLHLAASVGNARIVEAAIEAGAVVNARDWAGSTPLHLVDGVDAGEIVRILIDAGSDIEARDDADSTPLSAALLSGRDDVVSALRTAGAREHLSSDQITELLRRAIDEGAETSEIGDLLERGGDSVLRAIQSTDDYGRTVLHFAVLNGAQPGVLLTLLDYGADPFVADQFGDSPFVEVLYRLDLIDVLVELLSDPRSIDYRDGRGRTALHIIAARDADLIPLMIEFGHEIDAYDDEGFTPLAYVAASEYRDADLSIEVLLNYGAYADSIDIFAWSPIMHAARAGNEVVYDTLVSNGADPYALDGNGQNVLCHAAAGGSVYIVEDLIDRGADLETGGPLVQASFHGRVDAARLLLDAGAESDSDAPVFASSGDRYRYIGSYTPFEAAAANDHSALMNLLSEDNRL